MQGGTVIAEPDNTWLGVGFTEDETRAMAEAAAFELRYSHGAGTQEYWVWLFRK